jgi:hypothetical protein
MPSPSAVSVRLLPPIDARPHRNLQTADFALG